MARRLTVRALRPMLFAAAAVCVTAASAAEAPGASRELAKGGSTEVQSSAPAVAGPAPLRSAPLHELGTREEGRDYKGQLAVLVTQHNGLAVIADFSDARLEDWTGLGFKNVDQIESQLRLMEGALGLA